ncbi:MAG: SRPBCC family protein [Deltaproteobacteria bacterium]|nr:SRPBCC family protein [Deltaproteobacteria bacterium]
MTIPHHDKTLRIRAQGERELVITREFGAPRELVFAAYTTPELLVRWLGVWNGWKLDVCEVDLREGGKYRWVWRNADPSLPEMGMSGTYREVSAPDRLVCTELFDNPWYEGEALSTVAFVERDGVTTLTVTMRYVSQAARDGVLASDMEEGLRPGYDNLAEVLATM